LNGHEEVPATGSAKGQRQAFRAALVTLANPLSEQLPARSVRTTPEPSQAAEEAVDAGPDLDEATIGQARSDEKRSFQLAAKGFGIDALTLRPLAEQL